MAEVNLKGHEVTIETGNDCVVITKCLAELQGGRSVTVPTSVKDSTIKAGHVVVKDDDSGDYELLELNSDGDEYELDSETTGTGQDAVTTYSFPAGKSAVGVVKASVLAEKPLVAIMTQGQVCEAALPIAVTAEIKAALPHIEFV